MSHLPSWQPDYVKTPLPCIFNSCSISALHQQMVSHVQSWDVDSVLSHSHPHCPPVLITSLSSWSYSIHVIFVPLIEHYWLFLSWLYSTCSISGDLNIHFLSWAHPTDCIQPHRGKKYRDLDQPCSPARNIFIWKCQDLSTNVGTAHAAVTNPRGPLALTVLKSESLQGAESSAQVRKSLMFLQHSADSQLCTSRAVRVRTEESVAWLYSGNTSGTSGEQRKFLTHTHLMIEAAEGTELTGRERLMPKPSSTPKGWGNCRAEWCWGHSGKIQGDVTEQTGRETFAFSKDLPPAHQPNKGKTSHSGHLRSLFFTSCKCCVSGSLKHTTHTLQELGKEDTSRTRLMPVTEQRITAWAGNPQANRIPHRKQENSDSLTMS